MFRGPDCHSVAIEYKSLARKLGSLLFFDRETRENARKGKITRQTPAHGGTRSPGAFLWVNRIIDKYGSFFATRERRERRDSKV